MNIVRLRAMSARVATMGQQEAQQRRSREHKKENSRRRKGDRQQSQRDAWAQVEIETAGVRALSHRTTRHGMRRLLELVVAQDTSGPLGCMPMIPSVDGQEVEGERELLVRGDSSWPPAGAH